MNRRFRLAFSLIELIVVCGCIGIVMAMTIPAIMRVRAAGDSLLCKNNMRSIALAIQMYHTDYNCMPPRKSISTSETKQDLLASLSWRAHLLPYLEQSQLWTNAVNACSQQRITYLPPHDGYHTVVKAYVCPADSRLYQSAAFESKETAFTSYLGVNGSDRNNGMFAISAAGKSVSFSNVIDGLANTAMFGERPPPSLFNAGQWYSVYLYGAKPLLSGPDLELRMRQTSYTVEDPCNGVYSYGRGSIDNPCDRFHFWSLHPGGSFFAFADGSVHFISYKVDDSLMLSLATTHGGEVVSIDD